MVAILDFIHNVASISFVVSEKGWLIFCQLRTDEERWYWQLNLGSRLTIVLLFRIQKMAKPSADFHTTNILHMTTSVSQRLQIVCVLFKMIDFCVKMRLDWLYVIVGILCTCGKHLHDSYFSQENGLSYICGFFFFILIYISQNISILIVFLCKCPSWISARL